MLKIPTVIQECSMLSKSAKLLSRIDKAFKDSGPILYTKTLDKDSRQKILEVARKLDPDTSLKTVYLVDNKEVISPHINEYIVESCEGMFAYLTVNLVDVYFHDMRGVVWHTSKNIIKMIERLNSF